MSISVNDMQQRVAAELSTSSRVGYALVGLVALGMATVTGALALTEPDLPQRTLIALVAMTFVGTAWAIVALWVLRRRRVLLAGHRVLVTGVACVVTGAFAAGALALQAPLRVPTSIMSGLMFVIASIAWLHARAVRARLITRRDALMKGRA